MKSPPHSNKFHVFLSRVPCWFSCVARGNKLTLYVKQSRNDHENYDSLDGLTCIERTRLDGAIAARNAIPWPEQCTRGVEVILSLVVRIRDKNTLFYVHNGRVNVGSK